LVPLARSDNRSVQFGIGGSVTHQGGLRCTSDGINVFAATSSDGVDYETSEEHLAVQDHTLVPASPPSTGTVNASDPSFASFGVFDCGDVPQP
jgi:hypothetical protein